MSNERVQFNLTERFAAPLPEFYRRRIVFWKDEDREFEKDVDELNLEGVKIIKLTGTNNFAVKKLLLHDDLDSNYLIYCPITYTGDEDSDHEGLYGVRLLRPWKGRKSRDRFYGFRRQHQSERGWSSRRRSAPHRRWNW